MSNILKKIINNIPLPVKVKKTLIKINVRFINYLNFRKDEEFLIDYYYGDLKAWINPIYPIECVIASGKLSDEFSAVFQKLLPEGGVGVDVGANVGAVTLLMSKIVGESGKVFAFEPGPFLIERLKKNILLNKIEHIVDIFPIGLSDREDILFWEEDLNNRGNAGLLGKKGIEVKVSTLDKILAVNKKIDFIKIDVEGMELEVIRGGIEILKKYKPILLYETHPDFVKLRNFNVFTEIRKILEELNYDLYEFNLRNGFSLIKGERYPSDTIAVPKGHNLL